MSRALGHCSLTNYHWSSFTQSTQAGLVFSYYKYCMFVLNCNQRSEIMTGAQLCQVLSRVFLLQSQRQNIPNLKLLQPSGGQVVWRIHGVMCNRKIKGRLSHLSRTFPSLPEVCKAILCFSCIFILWFFSLFILLCFDLCLFFISFSPHANPPFSFLTLSFTPPLTHSLQHCSNGSQKKKSTELSVTKWVVLMENQGGGKEELIIHNVRVKK